MGPQGLKPTSDWGLYAALKRRSSTVLQASDLFWIVGVRFADGGVGIFRGRRWFLDGRWHGFGGGAEAEGRERGRDEIWIEMHGVQMQELGEGFGVPTLSQKAREGWGTLGWMASTGDSSRHPERRRYNLKGRWNSHPLAKRREKDGAPWVVIGQRARSTAGSSPRLQPGAE